LLVPLCALSIDVNSTKSFHRYTIRIMNDSDREFIRKAIDASKQCAPEPGKPTPKVGAVVVKDGKILAVAFRGQMAQGDHAEFTVLEKMLEAEIVAGATVYTTLEPCVSRNHPKAPCAKRLIDRKVIRVVIGMIDPNPAVHGHGIRLLRDHNVAIDFFPADLAAEVEDLNREFRRQIEFQTTIGEVLPSFVERYKSRDIDEWHKGINYIFADRNFHRDPASIFTHLVEVVGGLSQLASSKRKAGLVPELFLPKALAWWFALCGKVGITSVAELLWLKFPRVCPYCQREEHDSTICSKKKKENPIPNWADLKAVGRNKKRPSSLGDWQRMFRAVYKPHHKPEFESTFARLTEELGELAEAVRVFPAAPGYFVSEAADVYAWLMNIQNNIDFRDEKSEEHYGVLLEESFCKSYPDYCKDCRRPRCICPPILESTMGRIAKEFPEDPHLFNMDALFVSSDKARTVFRPPK
jgi:pyrimidine deaminase RibD-like protein/NTP pyrophosphatase (non-canonical NTP hydrolase)